LLVRNANHEEFVVLRYCYLADLLANELLSVGSEVNLLGVVLGLVVQLDLALVDRHEVDVVFRDALKAGDLGDALINLTSLKVVGVTACLKTVCDHTTRRGSEEHLDSFASLKALLRVGSSRDVAVLLGKFSLTALPEGVSEARNLFLGLALAWHLDVDGVSPLLDRLVNDELVLLGYADVQGMGLVVVMLVDVDSLNFQTCLMEGQKFRGLLLVIIKVPKTDLFITNAHKFVVLVPEMHGVLNRVQGCLSLLMLQLFNL
jgi:hypothetical protein